MSLVVTADLKEYDRLHVNATLPKEIPTIFVKNPLKVNCLFLRKSKKNLLFFDQNRNSETLMFLQENLTHFNTFYHFQELELTSKRFNDKKIACPKTKGEQCYKTFLLSNLQRGKVR
jgi:hypothetical protein